MNTVKRKKAMLTTVDNPFNPFTEYDKWYAFDVQKGYHSCSLLASVAKTSLELSEEDYENAIDAAIDEIIKENVSGMHRKIYEDEDIRGRGS